MLKKINVKYRKNKFSFSREERFMQMNEENLKRFEISDTTQTGGENIVISVTIS